MVHVVCLQGQAQECFVEKSLKGVGRVKNNTVAKLAARVRILMSQEIVKNLSKHNIISTALGIRLL